MTSDPPVFQTETCGDFGKPGHKLGNDARRSYSKVCSACSQKRKRWLQRREMEELWEREAEAEADGDFDWYYWASANLEAISAGKKGSCNMGRLRGSNCKISLTIEHFKDELFFHQPRCQSLHQVRELSMIWYRTDQENNPVSQLLPPRPWPLPSFSSISWCPTLCGPFQAELTTPITSVKENKKTFPCWTWYSKSTKPRSK